MPSVAYLFVSAVRVYKGLRCVCTWMQLVYDRISTLANTSTPSLMRLYQQANSNDVGPIENEAPLSHRACGTCELQWPENGGKEQYSWGLLAEKPRSIYKGKNRQLKQRDVIHPIFDAQQTASCEKWGACQGHLASNSVSETCRLVVIARSYQSTFPSIRTGSNALFFWAPDARTIRSLCMTPPSTNQKARSLSWLFCVEAPERRERKILSIPRGLRATYTLKVSWMPFINDSSLAEI